MRRFAWWLVAAGGAVLAVGLGGGWWGASRAIRPVKVEHQAGPLDVSAALTSDRKALTVAVVNPTSDTVKLKLNLNSVKPFSVTLWPVSVQ